MSNQLPMEQRCGKCREVKPASEFWVDRERWALRLQRSCKDCSRRHVRETQVPRLKTNEKHKEKRRIEQRRYYATHPDVVKAHARAREQRAQLLKDKCEHCGATGRLHMHHPDYSRPLDVVTLCNPCHEAVHHPRTRSNEPE